MTLLSSRDVWDISAVSNARLLRWVHAGIILPAVRPDGNGSKAMYSPHEAQIVRVLSRFDQRTMEPQCFLGIARTLRAEDDWTDLALVITESQPQVCKVGDLPTVLELAGGATVTVVHLGQFVRANV